MRRVACLCCAILVIAGCAGSDEQPDVAADSLPPAPAGTPAISAADVAGKWNVEVMPENSDSVTLRYVMTASADTAGWSIQFPDRTDPVKVQVLLIDGDSIVTRTGPFPSALRKGVTVTTESVSRMQGGEMTARHVAHYSQGPDSVVVLRSRATRAQ
jgi:hypothetical protein